MSRVLRAIGSAEVGGILFHCGAGWDRTELVAAVLLRALDVTEDAASADYVASFANAHDVETLHRAASHVEERREVLERFGHSAESAFREAYRGIDLKPE